MPDQLSQKKRARVMTVMRFYLASDRDLEAAMDFDRTVCKALDIDPEAEPPTFLTDPKVLD